MATAVAAAGLAVLALTGGAVATAAPAEMTADCQIYWPSPFRVCDQTKDLCNSLDGAMSPLGFPSSVTQAYGTDGLRQTFTGVDRLDPDHRHLHRITRVAGG
ncbi:hypothetical protein LQ384_28765 [Rhodococcus rhodochrous]|uniref:Uncharacterized protein n=1 Tax=Rhodococcus rhodochrous TaxID=1829 RepID=A0AAW4XPD2_RHORH|nr:hypothetical protein [Rhodococcus rhodochrous]MCD2115066.1 hypothetical protein [Rhodococcus rhodochrous]